MSERSPVVLVVEDEKQIRRFVRASLEEEGCRVFEAGSCADGLLEAGANKPDLIVLDLGLPGIDGFEVLRRDSKGIVDIITYDDLLARLQAVLDQLRSGPALSTAPVTLQAE